MKKQFGIAMVALTAAMAFTFTACNDDSTSVKEPSKVSKAEDLSKDCEDGEEALVGDKEVLYTCKDGKWETEEAAKSSASKPKSSSSKVEDSDEDECDEDLENCDEDEEEEVKSSSSKKKPSSASSGESGGSTSKCTDTKDKFCYLDELYPYCNGKKYTPKKDGECRKDGNYYYNESTASYFEDLRDETHYSYLTMKDGKNWMTQNLEYTKGLTDGVNYYTKNTEGYTTGKNPGVAYTWATAMGSTEEKCGFDVECDLDEGVQGICPSGWHLPTKSEWEALLKEYALGDLLSSTWASTYDGTTASSGFNAEKSFGISDGALINYPIFWTSTAGTKDPEYYVYAAGFYFGNTNNTQVLEQVKGTADDMSSLVTGIRCVQNATAE